MDGKIFIGEDDSKVFETIGEAIEVASAGDTITLGPGVYEGRIILAKALKIVASMEATDGQVKGKNLPSASCLFLCLYFSASHTGTFRHKHFRDQRHTLAD